MRKYWNLPREEEFRDTGKDWLLILLSKQRKKEQGQILLLLWRAWHLRNNIIHGDGKESIKHSVEFLLNYARELDQNSSGNDQFTDVVETLRPKTVKTWKKPEPGSIKVNVDASFISSDGQASVGIVARNEKGEILFSAARTLLDCNSAEEAELHAISDGLSLATSWLQGVVICETDCSEAATAINKPGRDLSQLCYLINDIKDRLTNADLLSVVSINRSCNRLAHNLAADARICNTVGFWLGSIPDTSEPLFLEECNLIST
jgi:ribonuclease HI